ncbi:MAG: AraC family ligand binding domain-containing protein [Polyangiaceae bacterium]
MTDCMQMRAALFQPFPMLPGRRAQLWRHRPAYRRPRHFHAEPELNLVLGGRCTLGVGAAEVTLTGGDYVLFQPGQDHELLEASDDLELFVLALTPELASAALGATTTLATGRQRLAANELARAAERLRSLDLSHDSVSIETGLGELFEHARADCQPPTCSAAARCQPCTQSLTCARPSWRSACEPRRAR